MKKYRVRPIITLNNNKFNRKYHFLSKVPFIFYSDSLYRGKSQFY